MAGPGVSKSRFANYLKCPKLGYMSCYRERYAALADPPSGMTKRLLEAGLLVGRIAREYFPGGYLVSHVLDPSAARAETDRVMADPQVTDVFEAAFAHGGFLSRADVVRKVGPEAVDLIEVKATNKFKKADHIPDVAFQLALMEDAGLTVRSVSLMHLDPAYTHPGGSTYDLEKLFLIDDVTAEARRCVATELPSSLAHMEADLVRSEPPRVRLKNGCAGKCAYYRQVCGAEAPAYPVCGLGGNHPKLFAELERAGIQDLGEVPKDFPRLTAGHLMVLEALQRGGLVLEPGALRRLKEEASFPLWFIDFETYSSALPIFAGMHPWQHIPFQWSLHVLAADGSLDHQEFLFEGSEDPRRSFAESLVETVKEPGRVVVYNRSMESKRLKELAKAFPDLAEPLLSIDARILDLLDFVRNGCYHPDFHGSRSLKKVAPILATTIDYENLDLHAGMDAMDAYEKIIDPATDEAERDRLRNGLRLYCGMDTLATAEVFQRLREEAR